MTDLACAVKPERFGRYVLLDRIGEGGMAEVFRAIMPGVEGFKRTFVIKKILSQLSESAKFVDMFVREARIGALLNHPNIVQVFDFGSVDGHYFLAMEYLRGRDVLAIIRSLRSMTRLFPIPIAAYIAHEVAGCLAYAHSLTGPDGRSLNLVHRDVSPSNVMCLREGGVKLLDFGIASALSESNVERTEQGTFKGKLAYMAPERMRNETLDGRADLYSLGVMLWEMLTSCRLFRGSNEIQTFQKILEMKIPPPSTLQPDVPPSLDAIVMKMLERDRDKRYATGQILADDLEEVLRETKYKSRMLPKLLIELYGSGIHSSQVALSCLTPEMLAMSGTNEIVHVGTGSVSSPSTFVGKSPWRSRRLWGAVGVAAALLALAVLLGIRLGGGGAKVVSSPIISTPTPTVAASTTNPTAAPARASQVAGKVPIDPPPAPTAVPANSSQDQEEILAPATEKKSIKVITGKKPAKARPPTVDHPITSGHSIDPFAEAATRGPR